MFKIAVFDTKDYDKKYFEKFNNSGRIELEFIEKKLTKETVELAKGFNAVCIFVNDNVCQKTVSELKEMGVEVILTRSAGFNQICIEEADKLDLPVLRVPAYSPNAVAELAVTLLTAINRNIPAANNRVKKYDFSLNGLDGIDIFQKTVGVVGTGKIGKIFAQIMRGFGANVIAYDVYKDEEWAKLNNIEYVELDDLYEQSDIISLHTPLFESTKYMINKDSIAKMKNGVILINVSRGMLVNTKDLIEGLKSKKIRGAGLDVYENEGDFFFEDLSNEKMDDKVLEELLSFDNVLLTSHQAFFTEEALNEIYSVTLNNALMFMDNKELINKVSIN